MNLDQFIKGKRMKQKRDEERREKREKVFERWKIYEKAESERGEENIIFNRSLWT